jgi:hypothetical protein
MRWTKPGIMNLIREQSRFAEREMQSHAMAMYCVMKYCQNTPEQGLLLGGGGMEVQCYCLRSQDILIQIGQKNQLHNKVLVDGIGAYLTHPFQ